MDPGSIPGGSTFGDYIVIFADVAQLVEHLVANEEVARSYLVVRSKLLAAIQALSRGSIVGGSSPCGGIGRHARFRF